VYKQKDKYLETKRTAKSLNTGFSEYSV